MAQPEETLRLHLDKIATEENLKEYNVELTAMSTEGANYMSINYIAVLSSPGRLDLKLFAKVAQFSEAMRTQLPVDTIYQREIMIYTQLLSRYEELQKKYGIPIEDRYKFAKYYGGSSEFKEECIIMEDLVAQGHTLYDRFKPVTWDYAAKGVGELAKFHALSLVFKREYPNEYTDMFSKDEELFIPIIEMVKDSLSKIAQAALNVVPENLKPRVQKFLDDQFNENSYLKYYKSGAHGFIIHGDYRASNVLFKRQGGNVTRFVPVDFQGTRLGYPLTDLFFFIYCGTDAKFRRLHLKQLVEHYYGTLVRFLRLFNLDPDQEFPKKDFDEEYKSMHAYGLYTAITALSIVLIEPEDAPKVTSTEGGDMTAFAISNTTESYKSRFIPILNEFINYGIM